MTVQPNNANDMTRKAVKRNLQLCISSKPGHLKWYVKFFEAVRANENV